MLKNIYAGLYLLQKGKHFEQYGNQLLTGNALHYGWCNAQKLYIRYAHSEKFQSSRYNRCCSRTFYSWRLSSHFIIVVILVKVLDNKTISTNVPSVFI